MENARTYSVSVVMATYNGESFLRQQIDSIISQLNEDDELVISCNPSTDTTWDIVQKYVQSDCRIKCDLCLEKSVISNFQNAISMSTKEIICLCDQDDVWMPNKREVIVQSFESTYAVLIMHNCIIIDERGDPISGDLFGFRNARTGLIKNLFVNCYQGCCIAFKRELLELVNPIPTSVAMHDQWIGICAERYGEVLLIDEPLIAYRIHENNASDKRVPYLKKIQKICILLFYLVKRLIRKKV